MNVPTYVAPREFTPAVLRVKFHEWTALAQKATELEAVQALPGRPFRSTRGFLRKDLGDAPKAFRIALEKPRDDS